MVGKLLCQLSRRLPVTGLADTLDLLKHPLRFSGRQSQRLDNGLEPHQWLIDQQGELAGRVPAGSVIRKLLVQRITDCRRITELAVTDQASRMFFQF